MNNASTRESVDRSLVLWQAPAPSGDRQHPYSDQYPCRWLWYWRRRERVNGQVLRDWRKEGIGDVLQYACFDNCARARRQWAERMIGIGTEIDIGDGDVETWPARDAIDYID